MLFYYIYNAKDYNKLLLYCICNKIKYYLTICGALKSARTNGSNLKAADKLFRNIQSDHKNKLFSIKFDYKRWLGKGKKTPTSFSIE